MGKTRAECSQNAYTSHASAFLSHWIQILANSSPKSDIKKKKKTRPCFFAFYGRSGEGNITKKNLALFSTNTCNSIRVQFVIWVETRTHKAGGCVGTIIWAGWTCTFIDIYKISGKTRIVTHKSLIIKIQISFNSIRTAFVRASVRKSVK